MGIYESMKGSWFLMHVRCEISRNPYNNIKMLNIPMKINTYGKSCMFRPK